MKPNDSRSLMLLLLLTFLSFALVVPPGMAQELPVVDPVEDLDFDAPESWAMKLYASVSLLTSLGPIEVREPGSVEVALEGLSVPHLDREQRTVGFGGRKEEDLNRTPVWGRGRVTVGLPWSSAVTLAWAPPVRLDGVEASLVSAALEKNLLNRGPWTLGVRLYGQVGTVKGDLTCTKEDAQAAPGSPGNAFGCEAPSEDEVTMDYLGLELTAGYALRGRRAPQLHLGMAGQRLDTEFQVSAQTFGFLDRSLLRTEGETFSMHGGATWQLAQKARLSLEAFYSPLSVQRLGALSSESDDLFHLRAMVRYRLR
ncbi:MAG: hypothetical protein K0U98_20200 [Deltaproteobacteria bacterium]|nr:hypothetical protein [Deltaproteobacteria bacterium]